MSLLDKAKKLEFSTRGARTQWRKLYYDVAITLCLEKGMSKLEAADWICAEEGITGKRRQNLYRVICNWVNDHPENNKTGD